MLFFLDSCIYLETTLGPRVWQGWSWCYWQLDPEPLDGWALIHVLYYRANTILLLIYCGNNIYYTPRRTLDFSIELYIKSSRYNIHNIHFI